jgi:agmatine/peptidylarginine deiminase
LHKLARILVSVSFLALAPPVSLAEEATVSGWQWDPSLGLPRWREGGTPPVDPNQPLTPFAIVTPQATDAPSSCEVASPPEYSPSDGIMLRYSSSTFASLTTNLVAALTGDPSHDEIAYVVVSSSSQQTTATTQFTSAGADMSKVRFIIKPTETIWLRDYGPHFIWQGGGRAIVDSHYYPTRANDNFIPTITGDDYFREPTYDIGLYYSGGNFQPGPDRSGFVTSLISTDNPAGLGFTTDLIGELYQTYQGIDTLHILPRLPATVDGTGHIDMWMYLVDEDTVMISEFPAGSHATAISVTNNAVPYMENLGFEVHRIPARNCNYNSSTHACPVVAGNNATHYTYANAFRVNDRIFIPTYGQGDTDPDNPFPALDAQALAAWQQAAGPGVEIIGINSFQIIPQAGAIHCIVMQVPRYTDSSPSSCMRTPKGGELLVAGGQHDIEWVANDDQGVDAIDVYYAPDGSTWEPVSLGNLGNLDEIAWTPPPVESDDARVKVVATDEDLNATEAISDAPFSIASALQHVYDFSSGAGVDKFGWGHQTTFWQVLNGVRKPASLTQLSAANYAALATSNATGGDTDSNRYRSAVPTGGSETSHVFEFTIAEDPATILDLGISWEGYADDCMQMELFVWSYTANQWTDGGVLSGENRFMDNFAGNRDELLSGRIRENIADFIGPGGQLTLLLYGERPGEESFHDYLSVTVTHDPCTGLDTDFDGWANGCDNCPEVPNVTQANADLDPNGDACDCNPNNATVFAIPAEIGGMLAESPATFSWETAAPGAGSATLYDVLRGELSTLGSGYGDTCLASDWSDLTIDDASPIPPDTGYYYLVRGTNSCGIGTYGQDSSGNHRLSTVCP